MLEIVRPRPLLIPGVYTAALADEQRTSLACEVTDQGGFIVATTQEALQVSTIVPSLTVDDLQKSITFYEALGFVVDERWEDNGTLLGVMMRAGKSQIGLRQDRW